VKSKKAQVGKIIATLPVLVLVVIVMGIFMALTYAVAAQNIPDALEAKSLSTHKESLHLQTIKISLQTQPEKEMLFFDALSFLTKDHYDGFSTTYLTPSILANTIANTLDNNNDCYYLDARPVIQTAYKFENGKAVINNPLKNFFENKHEELPTIELPITTGTYSGKSIKTYYYFGTCP